MLSAGAMHHTMEFIPQINKGIYTVSVRMDMPLLNGTYFLNVGVAKKDEQQIKILARHLDALSFNVSYKRTASRGLMDLKYQFEVQQKVI